MRFRELHWSRLFKILPPTTRTAAGAILSFVLIASQVQGNVGTSMSRVKNNSIDRDVIDHSAKRLWQLGNENAFEKLSNRERSTNRRKPFVLTARMARSRDRPSGFRQKAKRSKPPSVTAWTLKNSGLHVKSRTSTTNDCRLKTSSETLQVVYECRPTSQWNVNKVTADDYDTLSRKKIARRSLDNSLSSDSDVIIIDDAVVQWSVPVHVTDLRLWKQQVGAVGSNAFEKLAKTLEILHLEHNHISYVSKKAFSGLHKLRELDLSYNRLQSLPSCVFADLASLKFLSLKHNELELVRKRTLSGLNALTFLDLSSNLLEDIHGEAFLALIGRRSIAIDLRRNRLRYPRKEWLTAQRSSAAVCTSAFTRTKTNHEWTPVYQNKSAQSSSGIQNRTENATSTVATPVTEAVHERNKSRTRRSIVTRVLWATENLWDCGCSDTYDSLDFLEAAVSLSASTTFSLPGVVSDWAGCSENHSDSFIVLQEKSGYYAMWDISMSCDRPTDMQGHNLASPFTAAPAILRSCCATEATSQTILSASRKNVCRKVSDWVAKSQVNCSNIRSKADNDGGLKESEVTIIGIMIVVLVPVFLTLCPDCDRTIVPTHRTPYSTGAVVGSAHVGACVANANICNNSTMTRQPQVLIHEPEKRDVFHNTEVKESGV